jgi:hypothetical protein
MRLPILVFALSPAVAVWVPTGGQEPVRGPVSPQSLTDAQKEQFLLGAQIVHLKGAPGGVTGSQRATLRGKDGFLHDAHIQPIDEEKQFANISGTTEVDFRDSYKNNVAAYRMDRLLGLGMVPVTVVRHYELKKASFMWWVDDVAMDEKARVAKKLHSPDVESWNRQMYVVRVFDQLIYNFDRNLTNLLICSDWRVWMIDHSRAFKVFKDLKNAHDLGPQCERGLLLAMRQLDAPTLKRTMKDLLNELQIEAVLARRDIIVKHYDERIAAVGEGPVLYDLPWRVAGETAPQ